MIPFFDLKNYNQQFQSEFQLCLNNILSSGEYIKGKGLQQFEKNFATYCGANYCIGTANGLDALELIFEGLITLRKLNKGDEVLVPANTFIASILSIIRAGLNPVLIEPNETDFNLSVENVSKAINHKTKAILAVHLYGQLADMKRLNEIATANDLLLIEDAAQAHGAENLEGKRAGNLSDVAAFSFYPSKNLGALGDGGAVTTNNKDIADMVRMLGNYGSRTKYQNEFKGRNSRLDELQALFLNIKLKNLDADNSRRQEIAHFYLENLKNDKIRLPKYSGLKDHVFHQFVLRVESRDDFIAYMAEKKIGTLIHYPIAPHKQKALKEHEHLSLPITEAIHNSVVSIPLNPTLKKNQIDTIVKCINTY